MTIHEFDWESFGDDIGKYLFAEAYIQEVESLADEESETYNPAAYRELAAGPGSWDDLIPLDIPDAALIQGQEVATQIKRQVRKQSPDTRRDWLVILADLMDDDRAGFLAAMESQGAGVGLWEYDIDINIESDLNVGIRNAAYDIVQEEVDEISTR